MHLEEPSSEAFSALSFSQQGGVLHGFSLSFRLAADGRKGLLARGNLPHGTILGNGIAVRKIRLSEILMATAAGAAGSLAMDLVQDGFDAIFERRRPPGDRDEETEAIVSLVRRIAPRGGALAKRTDPGLLGRALHYTFGCGFAVAYTRVRKSRPQIATADGLLFGAALWLVSDVILIPVTHLGRPWSRYTAAERANALVSHLAYAAAVETSLRFFPFPWRG
jgi:hypothetical protein